VRLIALLVLAVSTVLLLTACSRKAERIVGASRLARGADGLGATVRSVHDADRDTYVEPGGSDSSSTLFVGWQDNVEARSFFDVTTWQFPDTLPGFQVGMGKLPMLFRIREPFFEPFRLFIAADVEVEFEEQV